MNGWQFTKYGLIVTAVTVGLSLVYVWLRYFALARRTAALLPYRPTAQPIGG